jgi:DNA polymerase I
MRIEPTTAYLDGRDPARILEPGTFQMPGFPGGAQLTYGHDAVRDLVPWLVREPVLSVDIETEGLGKRAWYIKVVTVSTANHAVLFDPRDPAQFDACRTALNSGAMLVIHNSPYDVPPIALNGLLTEETIKTKILDTLIYARMAEPDDKAKRSLAACAARYLGFSGEDTVAKRARNLGVTKSKYFEVADLDRPAYRWDAATDALATFRLLPLVRQAAYDRQTTGHPFGRFGVRDAEAWDLIDQPQRRNRIYLVRSSKGFNWDPDYLDDYRMKGAKTRAEVAAELSSYSIRPGISQDMVTFLDKLGLVPNGYPRTDTGLLSGKKGDLEKLTHPLVDKFLWLKADIKSDEDYMSKVRDMADHVGRVHPEIHVLGASSSGRDAIRGLPLHQFNAEARQIILEDGPGIGVSSVDWSQQEAIVAANLAGDRAVLARYEDDSLTKLQRDAYQIIADFGGITRKPAKETFLAQMFGQGMRGLALKLGMITPAESVAILNLTDEINPDTVGDPRGPRTYFPREAAAALGIGGLEEAERIKAKVWEVMPGTEKMVKQTKDAAKEYKVTVTWSGRILPIPTETYRGRRGVSAYKGPNYRIQGGAADMLNATILEADAAGLSDTFMLPMHDEVVVQRDAAPYWAEIMQRAPERMNWVVKRTAKFRTDTEDLGERWGKPA